MALDLHRALVSPGLICWPQGAALLEPAVFGDNTLCHLFSTLSAHIPQSFLLQHVLPAFHIILVQQRKRERQQSKQGRLGPWRPRLRQKAGL